MGRTDAEGRNELREGDEEEVEVEEELELFVEDEGEEGGDIVLLVPNEIGRELALLVGAVEQNRARLAGGTGGGCASDSESLGPGLRLLRLEQPACQLPGPSSAAPYSPCRQRADPESPPPLSVDLQTSPRQTPHPIPQLHVTPAAP